MLREREPAVREHWSVAGRASVAVPFQRPQLPPVEQIEAYFQRSRAARWYSNRGPCFELLAERIKERIGVPAEPVANATLALVLALRAATLESPPGPREVLLPSFTFLAAASAVVHAGYEPVFVDVDPVGWHPDPRAIDDALEQRSGRVVAVLASSTFGTPPPPDVRGAWERSCRDAGVPLIVDSAAGFGAVAEDGHHLGGQGDAEVFSFHATKPLAIGEGGVLTSADATLLGDAGSLANFGFAPDRSVVGIGLNAKLDEWHAATALAALDLFDDVIAARRQRAGELARRLDGFPLVAQAGSERSTHQFVPMIAPDSTSRARVLEAGMRSGVQLRAYFAPSLHQLQLFDGCVQVGGLEVTEWLAERCLALPMANDLRGDEIETIVGAVAEGLAT